MTVMEQLAKLEKEFSAEQAKALMDVIEQQTVTRDYLKGELQEVKTFIAEVRNQMLLGTLVIASIALGIAKLWI
jgi:hypothetical protein